MRKKIIKFILFFSLFFILISVFSKKINAQQGDPCTISCNKDAVVLIKVAGITKTYTFKTNYISAKKKCCIGPAGLTNIITILSALGPIPPQLKNSTSWCSTLNVWLPGQINLIIAVPDPDTNCPDGYMCNPSTLTCQKKISIIEPVSCDCNGKCCAEWEHSICTDPVGIQTVIGCFPTDPEFIPGWLLGLSLPLAGAAAFMLMLYGAFLIITSSGDPEKLKEGQEILFSALAGLLLIIFSVFILRLVGVTILRIPGFG
jgi:hypothetical protein